MFNIITNWKNREVINSITLEELVDQLKNPSTVHKKIVDKARELGKGSKQYAKIKESLPCIVPNYNHKDYVKADTITKSTGFIYIDIDYAVDIDFAKYDFIAASWKSLSNTGIGLLISVNNMDTINTDLKLLRCIINDISNVLDIKPDEAAISRDRLNVVGYDTDVYYNPNYTPYTITSFTNNKEEEEVILKKETFKNNNYINNRLRVDVHFFDYTLRLSNLDEMTKDLTFKDDELYKVFVDDKIKYTEAYIPKTIKMGSRNFTIFRLLSTIKALNPHINENRVRGIAKYLNNKCYEQLSQEELNSIIIKVVKKDIKLFPNKTKTYIFNPIYTLDVYEKRVIRGEDKSKRAKEKMTSKLIAIINKWNKEEDGKFTMKALSIKAGVCYKTVLRYKKEIKTFQNNLHN
jgi:hypothetical protein